MFRLASIMILLILPLQSIASLYTVNLAVYKNSKSLHKKLNTFPPALRKTVTVRQKGELSIAYTLPTKNTRYLEKLLPSYQKVFSDAFISVAKHHNEVITKTQETFPAIKQVEMKVTPHTIIKKEIPEEISFYDKIKQKTLYLCVYSKASKGQKFLIRATFGIKQATYVPIIGKMPSFKLTYKIKNNRLYLFQEGSFNPTIYSKLEKTFSNYYLISSWTTDVKIDTMRYYYHLEDAKAYLKSLM